MEVSGLLHALATLTPGKDPLIPIKMEVEWAPELERTFWRGEISLAPATTCIVPHLYSL